MNCDPFSDVLRLTHATPQVTGGFSAGGEWAIRFPAPDKLKFFAMVQGCCWLCIDGLAEPVHVDSGDVLLLSAERGFVLAGSLTAAPVDALSLFGPDRPRPVTLGDSVDCVQIGGHVRLDPANGSLLTGLLPPLIHIRASSPQAAALRWLIQQLVHERAAELPGASLSATHLAQLIFVQILRAHLDIADTLAAGWLKVVADRRLVPALRLIHGEPAGNWRLEQLAQACAMSRTSFAHHFKQVAGVAPLVYLGQWRMRLAEKALRDEPISIASLAESLGYGSESAFSTAFKRIVGASPRGYRHAARAGHH